MKKLAGVLLTIFMAMWSAVAVSLMDVDIQTASCTLLYVRDCVVSSPVNASIAALIFVALVFLYRRLARTPYAWEKREILHGFLFAVPLSFVLALSPAYWQGDETLAFFVQPYHLLLLLFKLLGWIPLLFALYRELLIFLKSKRFQTLFLAPALASGTAGLRKKFLLFWGLLFLCWTPFWIARFPGVIDGDAGRALQQYFYETVRTNDHPYGYTLLLGSVAQLGVWLHSGNLGIALFILLQMVFLSGVFAFTLRDMAESGCSVAIQVVVFCFYAFLPIIASNVGIVIKDMMFSAAFVGYILVLSRAIVKPGNYGENKTWWAAFIVFSCLLLLFRHNGKMVVWPMTIYLVVSVWMHAPHKKGLAHSALLLTPVAIAFAFQLLIVNPALIAVDSTADILGIPIQQTARIIRDHEESITRDDRNSIDALYQYDMLASAYTPKISDPVRIKYRYFDSVPLRDKLSFLGTWAKLSFEHPLSAFHAFWAASSGYIDPTADGSVYSYTTLQPNNDKYPTAVGSTQPDFLNSMQDRFSALEAIWRELPVVKQLNNVGLYPWLLFLGFLLLKRKPNRRIRWMYLPYLAILIACLLAPGFNACTRYAFPLVYGAPYLLVMTAVKLAEHKNSIKMP